jgi:RNA polymerase sigma-70 factor (ECF subfamily)
MERPNRRPRYSNADRETFAHLYNKEMARIYRYIRYRVGSVAEAEDLTSEVFHRALNHWPRMRRRLRSPRAWLFTIATNLVTDYYRQRGTRSGPSSLEDWPNVASNHRFDPEEALIGKEEVATLMNHLSELSDRDRTILTLRFAGELSHQEIGAILEISEGASAVALLRALRRLRKVYQGVER